MSKKEPQILEDAPIEVKSALSRAEKREDTRSSIALSYVIGYLILVFIILIRGWWLGINDLKDLLVTLSGILSGPLGFIVGYYFKSESNND
ncbi:MAG: hypothetical protein HYY86_00010 [Candidatus Harrisonbacteria bacterium]|nr:hypothetical protein [Candidatus Harrisonbacteria bacterium]